MEKPDRYSSGKAVFRAGTISFVFLMIGYELALFVHRAAELRIQERRDHPDTVYVIDGAIAGRLLAENRVTAVPGQGADSVRLTVRRDAKHPRSIERARAVNRPRECFRFNPNTASMEEFVRLGFSEKQAQSIINYREKGGRFARKSDFAKSYVVADSVYRRLEPYIDIPSLDINKADSAAFDALPGIGGYFASKMVSYREQLGGYSCTEQLMEIWKFDRERFEGISDLIFCSPPEHPFDLWGADEQTLASHPHIRNRRTAHAIVLYRDNTETGERSVQGLEDAGIIDGETARKLERCALKQP